MILPIGTNNPLRRRPTANYVLIAVNFAIFLATYNPHFVLDRYGQRYPEMLRTEAQPYVLSSQEPQLYQFLTYGFLHANWAHIIGNMLFLYIFGNNVNDKLGHVGYLLLYLGGVVFSGLGHILQSEAGVLGASGAVAAITGAYMVLFPKTNIIVLYIIFFIGTLQIPALYFIVFKLIIFDNILEPEIYGGGNIAYGAHLAGYIFGIAIPLFMLAFKMLPHSHFDLWALIDRWNRRRQLLQVVEKGYNPFGPDHTSTHVEVAKPKREKPVDPEVVRLRMEISLALSDSRLDEAIEKYLKLQQIDENQVMAQQQQIDIANKFMQMEKHSEAAEAYEKFIKHYQNGYAFIEQIELMLGLIYSRYLKENDKAQHYLKAAQAKLSDEGQKKMCEDELARMESENS